MSSDPLPASLRDPSTLFYQSSGIKRAIILSYWTIILLVIPLWWYTTSIQRLSLPNARILSQTQRNLHIPVDVCVDDDLALAALQRNIPKNDSETRRGLNVRVYAENQCPNDSYHLRNDPKVFLKGKDLYLPLSDHSKTSILPEFLAPLINIPATILNQDNRVVQYSPRYRLAFTLLNEDASAGYSISDWDIQTAIARRIESVLEKLSPLHNFTIESQVQYHGRLAFEPKVLNGIATFGLTPEDLTVFVNSAEWSLSSSASNDPVLHFVLFVPSPAHRPLHILTSFDEISPSISFLLPQWGGITIYNPTVGESDKNSNLPQEMADKMFQEFAHQLLTLLGVPPLPDGIQQHASEKFTLSKWQVDSLMRIRALENSRSAQETLTSIVKLVNQIENMPVKEDVKGDVQSALNALETMFDASSLRDIFRNSVEATSLASRAFFNPGMLALLYFPAEHKYAVYTPLFASAVIPLFVAALRELSAWRRERHASAVMRS